MREEKKGAQGNQTGVLLGPYSPNLSTMATGGRNDLEGLLKPPLFKWSKVDDPEQTLQNWNKYKKRFKQFLL